MVLPGLAPTVTFWQTLNLTERRAGVRPVTA